MPLIFVVHNNLYISAARTHSKIEYETKFHKNKARDFTWKEIRGFRKTRKFRLDYTAD
jgi:TPP-dependent pyruvate/acetoin dehydrogenase alpha subunit